MLYTLNVCKQIWINNLNFVARKGFQGYGTDEPGGISGCYNLNAMTGLSEESH
jgi:hypothetical protein